MINSYARETGEISRGRAEERDEPRHACDTRETLMRLDTQHRVEVTKAYGRM